jgi:uncharacterized membrane protein YdjX (TVP38/TMEM64 family)
VTTSLSSTPATGDGHSETSGPCQNSSKDEVRDERGALARTDESAPVKAAEVEGELSGGEERETVPTVSEAVTEVVGFDARPALAGGLVALLLALLGGGYVTGGLSVESFAALAGWFEKLGPAGIVLYAALYFVLELFAVPATPLTLGSGYLFGVINGTAAVSVAATGAAAASFLIARYGLRDYVAGIATNFPKFRSVDRAIGREGLKFVFLLRLSPLLPFAISNYLYGLTSVRFRDYIIGSWLGMLPGTIAYVSAGAAVGAISDLNLSNASISPATICIGAAATIAAVATIGKLASRAITEAEADELKEESAKS